MDLCIQYAYYNSEYCLLIPNHMLLLINGDMRTSWRFTPQIFKGGQMAPFPQRALVKTGSTCRSNSPKHYTSYSKSILTWLIWMHGNLDGKLTCHWSSPIIHCNCHTHPICCVGKVTDYSVHIQWVACQLIKCCVVSLRLSQLASWTATVNQDTTDRTWTGKHKVVFTA